MATSSFDSVYSFGSTKIAVPVGATLALLITANAFQSAITLKYFSGGTLELIGCPQGTTLTAQNLSDASGQHYLFATNETLNIGGPARFYLSSTSATTVVMALRGKSDTAGSREY